MPLTISPSNGDKVDVGVEIELQLVLSAGDTFAAGEEVTFYLSGAFAALGATNYGGMIPTDATQRQEALYGAKSITVPINDPTHASLSVFVWPGPDGVTAVWRAISSISNYDTADIVNPLNPFTLGGDVTSISEYESHPIGQGTTPPLPDAAANNYFSIEYQAKTDGGVAYTGYRWGRFYLYDVTNQGLTLTSANIGAWDAPDSTATAIPLTSQGDLFVRSDANSKFTFYLTGGVAVVNGKTLSGVFDPFLGSIGGESISMSGILLFVNLEANLPWLNPAVIIGSGTTYTIPNGASTVPFKIAQPSTGQKISPGDLLIFFNRSMNARNLGFKEITDPSADLGFGFNPTFTPPALNFYTDGIKENDVVYVVVSAASATVSTSSTNTYKMKLAGSLGGNTSPDPTGTGQFQLPYIDQLGTHQSGQLNYDNDSGGLTVKLIWPGISNWSPSDPPGNIGVNVKLWLNGWVAGDPSAPLQGNPVSPTTAPQPLLPADVNAGFVRVPVPFSMIQGYGTGPQGQPGTLQIQGFLYDTSVVPPKLIGSSPAHTVAFTSSKVGAPP